MIDYFLSRVDKYRRRYDDNEKETEEDPPLGNGGCD